MTVRVLIAIATCSILCLLGWSQDLLGEQATFDLRHKNLNQPQALKGQWDFYWQKFIHPDEFSEAEQVKADARIPIPLVWQEFQLENQRLSPFNHASYRSIVKLPAANEPITIKVAEIPTSYVLFIDGTQVLSSGRVGKSKSDAQPGHGTRYWTFVPKTNQVEIVFWVSNYFLRSGGFWHPPELSYAEAMSRSRAIDMGIDILIMSALLIMGFYHLVIFALRPKDNAALIFALICFNICLRTAIVGRAHLVHFIWPDFDWYILKRTEYFTTYAIPVLFGWFIQHLFKLRGSKILFQVSFVCSLFFLVMPVFADTISLSNSIDYFHYWSLAAIAYMSTLTIIASFKGLFNARLFTIGALTFAAFAIADILAIQTALALPSMIQLGLFQFIFIQAVLLARIFAKAFHKVESNEVTISQLNQKLQKHIESLDEIIEERTKSIRAILSHIKKGIFTVLPQGLMIHKEYSKQLEDLLGTSIIADRSVMELLFTQSDLSHEKIHQIQLVLESSLGESSLYFEANQNLLPREIKYRHPNGNIRIYELDWTCMTDDEDIVARVLFTVSDVTRLKELEIQEEAYRSEIDYLLEIIKVEPSKFSQFITSCMDYLDENQTLLENLDERDDESIKRLFINLHTIKGNARSLQFHAITQMVHDAEQYLANVRQGKIAWNSQRALDELRNIHDLIETYRSINSDKLGRNTKSSEAVTVDPQIIGTLLDRLQEGLQSKGPHQNKLLYHCYNIFWPYLYTDFRSLIDSLKPSIETLAKDLGKKVPNFDIDGVAFGLNRRGSKILYSLFTHILRNALDHGIESPDKRREAGKDETGTLTLRAKYSQDFLIISVADDGQGLNLTRIREIGLKKKLIDEKSSKSAHELAQLIFELGFSTSQFLSDISGRGVGMSAIRSYVEQVGGKLEIVLQSAKFNSQDNVGFALHIHLPRELYVLRLDLDLLELDQVS